MSTIGPADGQWRPDGGNGAGIGIGLVEPEERVGLALDEERRGH